MDNNEIKSRDLNYLFELVEKIYLMPISSIEKEFDKVKKNISGGYVIFFDSDIISAIRIFIQKKSIYRIEVGINIKNLKLIDIKSYLKMDYDVGSNLYDEETFFNFNLNIFTKKYVKYSFQRVNAIHFGLLPSVCNFLDKEINRIRFNYK